MQSSRVTFNKSAFSAKGKCDLHYNAAHNVANMIYTIYARNKSKRGNARTFIVIRDCVKCFSHSKRTEREKNWNILLPRAVLLSISRDDNFSFSGYRLKMSIVKRGLENWFTKRSFPSFLPTRQRPTNLIITNLSLQWLNSQWQIISHVDSSDYSAQVDFRLEFRCFFCRPHKYLLSCELNSSVCPRIDNYLDSHDWNISCVFFVVYLNLKKS